MKSCTGNRIGTNVGTVGTGTVAGTYTMEFKNWLSQVTGISDFEANARHFERIGVPVQKVNEIYTELTKNGVTGAHIAGIQQKGYSFDDIVRDYSKIAKISEKEIYSLMLQGGEYYENLETNNPGSWKGMLRGIAASGELSSKTKIALLDVTDGIGAYYRNTYNKDGYGKDSPSKKNAVTEIGKNERELVIRCYEEQYPEHAENLNEFFRKSGYSKDSITGAENEAYQKNRENIANIKYIYYSAPEPYRDLFLNNVGKESILIDTCILDSMNVIAFNGIIIDMDYAPNDRQGPYATFFHELGHGIDDLMYMGGNYSSHYTDDSSKYSGMDSYYHNKSQVTLKQTLEYDCYNTIYSKVRGNSTSLTQEEQTIAVNLLMPNREDKNTYTDYYMLYLSKTDSEREKIDQAVNAVKTELTTKDTGELWGEQNGLASDIYGGVSYNKLIGQWGHHDSWYWKLYDGGMTSREATADYFSMQMTGDAKALESTEKYLGNSSQFMRGMFTDMAEKAGEGK